MVPTSENKTQIPIESELQERLAWFIRLRWLAAAGIFLGAVAAEWIIRAEASLLPVYLLGLAVFAYNLVFHRYLSRTATQARPPGKELVFLQIGIDWVAVALLVHFTGGIRSPVTIVFALHVIIGAILLSRRSCFILAAFAASLTGALAALESSGIWPLSTGSRLLVDSVRGIASPLNLWIANAIFFGIIAYLATSITRRLREKEEALFKSERALDQAYHQMEALYQISRVINSTLEMNEVLSLITENAASLMGMKASFIRLLDPAGRRLHIGATYGVSQAYISKGPVDIERSLIDRETLEKGVIQVLDVGEDPRFQYREEARREGLVSVLCAAMIGKDRPLGVIRVYSAAPHRFSEQEEALLKNLANHGALAIENAHAYAELRTLGEQRAWFTRVTHHQLRAPLAAIQGLMEAIPCAGELTEKQGELLERASRRVKDAFEIIRDLLDLTAAQRPLEKEAVEDVVLGQALQKVIETARERARSKGIEFIAELGSDQVILQAQPSDLERIFSNLLDNAVKYTPPGGQVRFETAGENGCIRAEVSDTGIGIEPQDQQRIFEGFFRTKAAKETGEMGTGLGLSIVKHLVERYGGKLELQSAPGKGTRFIVHLPCRENS